MAEHDIEILSISADQSPSSTSVFHECVVKVDGITLECKFILVVTSKHRIHGRLIFKNQEVRRHKDYKSIRVRLIKDIESKRLMATEYKQYGISSAYT